MAFTLNPIQSHQASQVRILISLIFLTPLISRQKMQKILAFFVFFA